MKPWANFIARRALLVVPLLALAGAGLVILSARSTRPAGTAVPLAAVPTAPWQSMPTRAVTPPVEPSPEPTPAPDPRLVRLEQALLVADSRAAQREWDALQGSALVETEPLQVMGARLALLGGDLDAAEKRALRALELADSGPFTGSASNWSLLGVILNRRGESMASEQAFAIAQRLDPTLEDDLFDDRWRNAIRTGDTDLLAHLAGTYSIQNPDSELEPYYRASALLADGQPRLALGVLHPSLAARPDAPALFWFTLGDVYLALDSFSDAAVSLEVAALKVAHGDTSMSLITEAPIGDIGLRLARAYLATERCAEAEGLFRRLSASYPDLDEPLGLAVTCQTPTPTPTHWILRLQPTATP